MCMCVLLVHVFVWFVAIHTSIGEAREREREREIKMLRCGRFYENIRATVIFIHKQLIWVKNQRHCLCAGVAWTTPFLYPFPCADLSACHVL